MPLSRPVRAAEYINPNYMPQLALNIELNEQYAVETGIGATYQGYGPVTPTPTPGHINLNELSTRTIQLHQQGWQKEKISD